MNQINFLPESFRRVQRRHQRRPFEFAVILATLAVLVVLRLTMAGPDQTLAQKAQELDQQLDRVAQTHAEEDRLKAERSRLTEDLLIARETYQPISTTQVLSRLSTLTPQPVRLVSLKLSAERPAPQPLEQAGHASKKKKVVKSAGAKQATTQREPNRMRIELVGLAPTDDEIVQLIRRLEQDPVFSEVSLRNSKMTTNKTHFVREFRLDLEIDLDRRFVPVSEQGGASDAD